MIYLKEFDHFADFEKKNEKIKSICVVLNAILHSICVEFNKKKNIKKIDLKKDELNSKKMIIFFIFTI